MRVYLSGVGCGVVEWVKSNTLRWLGPVQRMENEEFIKVYLSSGEDSSRRGRPLGRWKDREKENLNKRGVWVCVLGTFGRFHSHSF